jgi:hypothetical protein
VCLPTALSGKNIRIFNQSGSTVNIYGSNTFAVPGTQDTINNVVGSTAYAGMTTLKNADCFVPKIGVWACTSGS